MNRDYVIGIICELCRRCTMDIIAEAEKELHSEGIDLAVKRKDSKPIFNWIMHPVSYQGISDRIADTFIEDHGNVTYLQISRALNRVSKKCDKLAGFEAFTGCGYNKGRRTCQNPKMFPTCPLPTHPLRNGRLNILAYSLYFFIRDVCQKDLIGFIDQIVDQDKSPSEKRDQFVKDLSRVYGMQGKIINMTFSTIFLGLRSIKPHWLEIGQVAIAVDTLVHNFLHRTGILAYYDMNHGIGACYGKNGCLKVIEDMAALVDCSVYFPNYPKYFPRFVQLSIWLFCSEGGEGICNGRMINDREPCQNTDCPLYNMCDRLPLYGE